MLVRTIALAAVLTMAGCAKEQAAPAAQAEPVLAEAPSPRQLSEIRVEKFEVTPQPVHLGNPVDVTVGLAGAPRGTTLTLAWFGPNGWLVTDMVAEPQNGTASFRTPAAAFDEPGRYHAALRSGNVHLADVMVDVTG